MTYSSFRFGIVGGGGWLGQAIVNAILATGLLKPDQLILSGRSARPENLPSDDITWTNDNTGLVNASDVIVLSVRPEQFDTIELPPTDKLFISVMAGISCSRLIRDTSSSRIVRAIPNAAAAIRQSFTPWYATSDVTSSQRQMVQELFNACGVSEEAPEEKHIDYCVGLTGSGAAFPALLAQALLRSGIQAGLPAEFSRRAARQVVAGASQLFAAESAGPAADPEAIVKEMIDYRGTTAAALQTMLDLGFEKAVQSGLDAAFRKATGT